MVKIKGLIIFEKLSLGEKIKSAFGVYRSEIREFNGNKVYLLKTGKYNDTVRKRFIRRKIRELAFYPETDKNRNVLSGEGFHLILRKNLIKSHISDIVKKYAGSRGIAKGKLTVCIASQDPTDILNELEKISDWLSEVIFTGKKNGRCLAAADSFYKETGISVILKQKDVESDFMIAERKADIPLNCKGGILCLEDVDESDSHKIIKGVKLELPEEAVIENIDDLVISELFNLRFKISKLKS